MNDMELQIVYTRLEHMAAIVQYTGQEVCKMKLKRLLVKLGCQGKSHKLKTCQILLNMHINGIGA